MLSEEYLKKAAAEYGTPLYIFDEEEAKKRCKKIKEILGVSVGLCFSIKANPFLIESAGAEAGLLEVCSPGELEICRALDVGGEHIIYSGVNKTLQNCMDAVSYDCREYTAESLRHVELMQQAAKEQGKNIAMLLRYSSGSQFGMSKDDIMTALDMSSNGKIPNIRITGIHYFVGTQRGKQKHRLSDLEKIRALLDEIKSSKKVDLKRVEYGPGFPVPYFEGEDFEDTLQPLREFKDALCDFASGYELAVEMGRFIASSCGYYITAIDDMKKTGDTNYCIIDGGINHINYLGSMMGMKNPLIDHIKMGENKGGDKKVYTLCGSLCTTNDIVVRQLELEGAGISDLLVFRNIGAYSVTEGIYLFLSRDLPAVALYDSEKGSRLVRGHDPIYHLNMRKK